MKQRWPPETVCARTRRSYEKIGDCRQFTERFKRRYGFHVFLFTIQTIFDYVHSPLAYLTSCTLSPPTPPPPAPKKKILHNLCFSFLLGIATVPKGIENNAYEKFWGANKVHYGRCANGVRKKNIRVISCVILVKINTLAT